MNQVKDILTKHGFWIGCGVIALSVLGVWFWTVGQIAEETRTNRDKIIQQAGKVNQVAKKMPHPNNDSAKEMDKILLDYARNVRQGWELVYAKQRGVLVWPDSFEPGFIRAVDKLRPIEAVPSDKEALLVKYREQYRDWIRDELPKLAKAIGAEWKVQVRGSAGQSGPSPIPESSGGPNPEGQRLGPNGLPMLIDSAVVKWNPANQQEIFDTHFIFTATTDKLPSTHEVLYAQESIWVLDSLVDIIARVNQNATARHEASVREIDYIRIGQSAGGVGGKVRILQAATTGANTGLSGAYGTPTSGQGVVDQGRVVSGAPSMETPLAPGMKRAPAEGRYLDQNYLPLKATTLVAALTKPEKDDDVVLTVAKRMPVRMRLRIDQRKLARLLAECGNSPLPFEVRQMRVNRESTAAGSTGSGQNVNYGPSGSPENPASGSRPINRDSSVDANEVWVELFGIVYIYNPANDMMLGLPTVTADAGVAPAAPPPAGPAAPAAPVNPAAPVPAAPVNPAAPGPAAPGAPAPGGAEGKPITEGPARPVNQAAN